MLPRLSLRSLPDAPITPARFFDCAGLADYERQQGEFYVPEHEIPYLFIITPIIAVPIFIYFGLYNAIIRYIGLHALWALMKAVSLYALIWGVIALISGVEGLLHVQWLLLIGLLR